jgi:hypothetical protein
MLNSQAPKRSQIEAILRDFFRKAATPVPNRTIVAMTEGAFSAMVAYPGKVRA